MKIYLVGGAIRDELLGIPVKERDWVVVGASPEELLALNFQPVGKDFPVFLHPETHEEYALARTERKVAKGYKGFTFYTSPDITLEDDLKRRDLTINAMARCESSESEDRESKDNESETNELIDPYGGQKDLKAKILRHISPAFSEDPVRILRIARFAAKLPNFSVSIETNQLMQGMVKDGEVDALVAERVWREFSRALEETKAKRFFEVLKDCDALAALFPMIEMAGQGVQALERASTLSGSYLQASGSIQFAALMHDIEHQQLKDFCQRYRAPKEYRDLALLVNQWRQSYQDILKFNAEQLLSFIKRTDGLRRTERFKDFLQACRFCSPNNNGNSDNKDNRERDVLLKKLIERVKSVNIKQLQEKDLKGQDFADALEALQISAIKSIKQEC